MAVAMRRHVLHPVLAALALLYLAAMVVSGAMPVQRQLVRFEAKGLLKRVPEEVKRVELSRGTRRVTLLRAGETEWVTPDGVNIGAAGLQVSKAVQIMHNSGPVREIEAAGLVGSDPAPFGLDPPRLSVKLYGRDGDLVLAASFGEFNPEGYLQYMRIDGNPRLYLMSRFVGGEWAEVMTGAEAR
ncbi:hypothetical protein DAA51_20385 [Bradyrhizobium sp. WBAH10]|nr:hypothetical protein [Bradyrhizobium sp. WBAH30]MDD1541259.1 hypothetical protein [Bradyrhizobium sp. WBAH41]MDD1557116.1 hypothetical protein [Bradyrhizobium sp. WBAH23]MDD1568570.1 hypothetical protein [Bradyrhizobium sp. WBAH33]MDD1589529.1 hypothetical protein [Bradyrhizobium sp. WBAH42]NRB92023.1 hypothetical protein [Bradyrhizobium sp. WBAH10]QCJ90648.1 hypothetical protein DAA57_20640 [Bradyrhizobium yuanmingense]